MRVRSNKILFIILTVSSILGLIALFPLLNNLDDLFNFNGEVKQTVEGDVDAEVAFKINFEGGFWMKIEGIHITMKVKYIYNESVESIDINSLHFDVYHNSGKITSFTSGGYVNFQLYHSVDLRYRDNITFIGNINLNYTIASIEFNEVLHFNMVYTHNIGDPEAQGYLFTRVLLHILYYASFVLVPLILYFIIHPDFGTLEKKEEEKVGDYYDFLKKEREKD
ncbi:MAG: hypothetical protein EAX91_11490 [Candidatus Lokiarchaeota archaeon]|nr:hypothetical protein [Candidatus Lokiarchaeota archaeon]